MKCVRVSSETWIQLMQLKIKMDVRSVDEVIKKLISFYSLGGIT